MATEQLILLSRTAATDEKFKNNAESLIEAAIEPPIASLLLLQVVDGDATILKPAKPVTTIALIETGPCGEMIPNETRQ